MQRTRISIAIMATVTTAIAAMSFSSAIPLAHADDVPPPTGTAYASFDDSTGTLKFFRSSENQQNDWYVVDEATTDPEEYPPWESDAILSVVFEDTIRPRSTAHWFDGQSDLTTFTNINLLDTSRVTNMTYMFSGTSSLMNLDLSGWDTSKVTDMSWMFSFADRLSKIQGLEGWDTSNVTDMNNMFAYMDSLTDLNIKRWDTGNVIDMSFAFSGLYSMSSLDLSGWDTHSLVEASSIFNDSTSLVTLDVSGWDTSKVDNMGDVFYGTESLIALNLDGWTITGIEEGSTYGSFAENLRQITLGPTWEFTDGDYLYDPPEETPYLGKWALDSPTSSSQYTAEEFHASYPSTGYADGKTHTWYWAELVTYELSYAANGDEALAVPATESTIPANPIDAPEWTTTVSSQELTREGYTFLGWNTAADGSGMTYKGGDSLTLKSEIPTARLYAQWQVIEPEDPKVNEEPKDNEDPKNNETQQPKSPSEQSNNGQTKKTIVKSHAPGNRNNRLANTGANIYTLLLTAGFLLLGPLLALLATIRLKKK